jgi:hypothetical protein
MKLQLTTESLQYWQDHSITVNRGDGRTLALSMVDMVSHVRIHKVYGDIGIIKLPKQKVSDIQWYYIVNLTSMLVVGRVRYNELKLLRSTFGHISWTLDSTDPKRMTLIATLGNVVTTFHCRLQYEYVIDE